MNGASMLLAVACIFTAFFAFIFGMVHGFDKGFKRACEDAGATYYLVDSAMHCEATDVALKAQGMRRAAEMMEKGE